MTPQDQLHDVFDRAWAVLMADHPEQATFSGWHEHHDRWTDWSPTAAEDRRRRAGEWLAELATVDRHALDELDRQSLEMFEVLERAAVDAAPFPAEQLLLNQMEGPQVDPAFVLSVMPRETAAHLDDLLARVRATTALVDQVLDQLSRGLATGVTSPRVVLEPVPAQVDALCTADPGSNPLLLALAGAPAELQHEAAAVVEAEVAPAFRRLGAFLRERYLPGARETIALSDLPDGVDWYRERVRSHTTTGLAPEEIHRMGLAEVERIDATMAEVMSSTGFTGTRAEFAEHLRTDPRFFFSSGEDVLRAYRDIAKRVDPGVVRLFSRLPRLPFGITAVPADQAPSQPAAYYLQGSVERARAGMFYANTHDLASVTSWDMESICLHEAVPGHHFQIALAQETEGLPRFRRESLACTAYVEGWGLYAESLGPELGLYEDPYQRFGALVSEMLRACRLVLDTGIHALGWSRDQALEFFVAHCPWPRPALEVETDRYIVWPGQALAYKVGQLTIQRLRDAAATRLGEAFDLRAFHDEILRHGALPLRMLEDAVEQWLSDLLDGAVQVDLPSSAMSLPSTAGQPH